MPRVEMMGNANVGIYSFGGKVISPKPQFEIELFTFRDPMRLFPTLDGMDKKVQEWIRVDPRYDGIRDTIQLIIHDLITKQGLKWVSIGFRDHQGKWKSMAMAELMGEYLDKEGFAVYVAHF